MSVPAGERLAAAFAATYGAPPTHMARAPGRVNLIGEHIDYAGLPVLPIAIQRQIRIAFRRIGEPECRIATTVPGLEPRSFRLDEPIEPYATGDWGNYVKAAAHGLRDRPGGSPAAANPHGVEALIESDLPVAAGLSSSSALVIAAALALTKANAESLEPLRLAALMADAEQFTGTRGGGMDQTICLCARPGAASLIDFDPLRVEPVPVPEHWRFVVADSLIPARKSGDARTTYNRRRTEVETALHEIGRAPSYRDLLAAHDADELLEAGEGALEADVRRRFRHVVTEAGRVRQAVDAMRREDMSGFGALMIASHRSLRDDYDVSTPELDELVDIALDSGAAGARLTGAGLGGSIVALVGAERAASVVEALTDRFYARRRSPEAAEWTEIIEGALFVAVPSAGASVRRVDPGD